MESLLLFCRALSSPTMCRFIPALSVPGFLVNSPTGGVGAGNLPINPVFQELRYAGLRSYVGRMKSEAVDHRAMLVILALHG